MPFNWGEFAGGVARGLERSRAHQDKAEERKLRERIAKNQEALRVLQGEEYRSRIAERARAAETEQRQEGQRKRLRDIMAGGDLPADAAYQSAGVDAPTPEAKAFLESRKSSELRRNLIGLPAYEVQALTPVVVPRQPVPLNPTVQRILESQLPKQSDPLVPVSPPGAPSQAGPVRFSVTPDGRVGVGNFPPQRDPVTPQNIGVAGFLQEELSRQEQLEPGESRDARVRAFKRWQESQVKQSANIATARTKARPAPRQLSYSELLKEELARQRLIGRSEPQSARDRANIRAAEQLRGQTKAP